MDITGLGLLVPTHLGALHPIEQALLAVVAFGPFVVLGVVVFLIRRRDGREDAEGPAR